MDENKPRLDKVAILLADAALLLLSNGANSTRATRNIRRFAAALGVRVEQFFSHSALVLTVEDPTDGAVKTVVRSIPGYGVNYNIISEISILSWRVAEERLSIAQISDRLQSIRSTPPYPAWLKMAFVGLATAALAKIFDGDSADFGAAFLAGVLGFIAKKTVLDRHYNVNMAWLFAAFVSATVVNCFRGITGLGFSSALTACVLWLIPGVPLINGCLDAVGGHITSGFAKLTMGFMLVFMIALGFYFSLFCFGYAN